LARFSGSVGGELGKLDGEGFFDVVEVVEVVEGLDVGLEVLMAADWFDVYLA
jgi:hypothetical protein